MDNLDEKLVERYLAGACTEAEMKQIFNWLGASEVNRKEWLKWRMLPIMSCYNHFSDPEQVDRSWQELKREHAGLNLVEKKITRRITLRFMRYAASILLLTGLSYLFYRYIPFSESPKMVTVAVNGNEPVRQISLDDNTKAWISAGSKVGYPEKFGKKERKVSVEGKVYFEVAPNVKRPFLVTTEDFTVKVLGTSFEVNAYRFRQLSDVTVVEGQVEILDNNFVSLCALHAGQQFEMDKLTNRYRKRQVDAEILTAWHVGELEFDGLTFAEIARALERQYDVQIILENGLAKDRKLVGSLSFQKDIDEMMRAISSVIPIRYDIRINTVVHIYPKN